MRSPASPPAADAATPRSRRGAGCTSAPPRAQVAAEPSSRPLDTAECAALGNIDVDSFGGGAMALQPYGWTHARIDVEQGAVVRVTVVDASPKQRFDEQAIAMMKRWRFPSGASAQGCFVTHRWD